MGPYAVYTFTQYGALGNTTIVNRSVLSATKINCPIFATY